MAQSFDTETFILEIESRSAIWNISSDEYSNRELKKKQWEELVEIFGGEGLADKDKKDLGQALQKKWKNIRSCFARETRRLKNTKSCSAASHKSPYIYYNQLLFLKNCMGNLKTDSNIEGEERLTNEPEPPLGPYTRHAVIGRKKKRTTDDGSKELLKTLNKYIDKRKNREDALERDEDKMFMLSLLSSFKKIPECKKSAAKIQIINLIESFRAYTPQIPMWQNYTEYEYEQGAYSTQGPGPSFTGLTSQQPRARPEPQNKYHTHGPFIASIQASTPFERPDSRVSIETSSASQDSDIMDLF